MSIVRCSVRSQLTRPIFHVHLLFDVRVRSTSPMFDVRVQCSMYESNVRCTSPMFDVRVQCSKYESNVRSTSPMFDVRVQCPMYESNVRCTSPMFEVRVQCSPSADLSSNNNRIARNGQLKVSGDSRYGVATEFTGQNYRLLTITRDVNSCTTFLS